MIPIIPGKKPNTLMDISWPPRASPILSASECGGSVASYVWIQKLVLLTKANLITNPDKYPIFQQQLPTLSHQWFGTQIISTWTTKCYRFFFAFLCYKKTTVTAVNYSPLSSWEPAMCPWGLGKERLEL